MELRKKKHRQTGRWIQEVSSTNKTTSVGPGLLTCN